MIRIITALAGAAGIFVFILPVFTGRILNIGNVTGLAVSLCLLLYGVLQTQIHAAIARGWRSGGICRGALAAAGLVLAGIAVTALILTIMIVRAALTRPSPDANVVVLGCEVKGERPSRMLTGRMDTAIAYLQEHPHVYCVLSGGKGENEIISEAECMFRYMTARGIAPERLIKEDRSVSTRENLQFSFLKLQEAGLADTADQADPGNTADGADPGNTADGAGMANAADGADLPQIAIVTNEFHACRAYLIAKDLGLRAGSVPAPSPWWLLPTFYVRELYGLLYQIFL